MFSLSTNPPLVWRRAVSSKQAQILADANATLRAYNTQLKRVNVDLKAANHRMEQEVRFLQVAVTILLSSSVGLGVAMATSMARATAQVSISSALAAFFAVIMASVAMLTFMRR